MERDLTLKEDYVLFAVSQRWMYGLEILDWINEKQPKLKMGFATLYPILNRLEKHGLIETKQEDSPIRDGARRMYFKATEEGVTKHNSTVAKVWKDYEKKIRPFCGYFPKAFLERYHFFKVLKTEKMEEYWDSIDLVLLGKQYRIIFRPIHQWQYYIWTLDGSPHFDCIIQCPWFSVLGSKFNRK